MSKSKAVSRDQVAELAARFLKDTQWSTLDGSVIQMMIELPSVEFGRRFTTFLKSGGLQQAKASKILLIDRSKPFDPASFFVGGWRVVEEDERALKLTTINFADVHFESGLKNGELTITTGVKLERLTARKLVRLDARVAVALVTEKDQETLCFLHDVHGITWMDFAGTVLVTKDGERCLLCLIRDNAGVWSLNYSWLSFVSGENNVSPVLPKYTF